MEETIQCQAAVLLKLILINICFYILIQVLALKVVNQDWFCDIWIHRVTLLNNMKRIIPETRFIEFPSILKSSWVIVIFCLNLNSIVAQESCGEKLYNANILFEKGKIDEAIELAKPCTIQGNEAEQWQSYHLLALAYLAQKDYTKARKTAEKMRELNPNYVPSISKDPPELVRLLESVKIMPKLTMGLATFFGRLVSYPEIVETYNGAAYDKNYSSKSSWQSGIILGYSLNPILAIQSGFIVSNKKYGINYAFENHKINAIEKLTYLNLPVYGRFKTEEKKNIRLFADLGIYTGWLLQANSDFKITTLAFDNTVIENEINNLDSKDRRNNWEYGAIMGAGLSYNLGKTLLTLDARYYWASFYNLSKAQKRYSNNELFYNYYYLDDDIRINNLAISMSFLYPISYKVIQSK